MYVIFIILFSKLMHQFIGNTTNNENITYFLEKIFIFYHVTYKWWKTWKNPHIMAESTKMI